MLYDIMDPGEEIKALVGGTYRAEQNTDRLAKHKGVAVATGERVIFVDKGVLAVPRFRRCITEESKA